ncbi:hypothetical protein B0H16DRAFT_1469952 [Mycena metata]|uniref:Uncharacterized protein n=1 Tax=Mycena metata TaxID=1033252 RepID=A0AAD7MRA1_9AGAR|nr:hypothetical protein B0H16DRAFT_1469952 [Mycena metata]
MSRRDRTNLRMTPIALKMGIPLNNSTDLRGYSTNSGNQLASSRRSRRSALPPSGYSAIPTESRKLVITRTSSCSTLLRSSAMQRRSPVSRLPLAIASATTSPRPPGAAHVQFLFAPFAANSFSLATTSNKPRYHNNINLRTRITAAQPTCTHQQISATLISKDQRVKFDLRGASHHKEDTSWYTPGTTLLPAHYRSNLSPERVSAGDFRQIGRFITKSGSIW